MVTSLIKHTEPKVPYVTINFYGDFRLIAGLGMTKVTFVVSKNTLCMASPVWFTMLNPFSQFIEGRADEVRLWDDDTAALEIILNIAHLHFEDLPEELEFDTLRQLAVLSDKYDMKQLVKPFLPAWVEPYKCRIFKTGYEGWLTIAWSFGYADMFVHLVDWLVTKTRVNEEGELTNKKGVVLYEDLPMGIIDRIARARLQFIETMLSDWYKPVNDVQQKFSCQNNKDTEACEAQMLGSLIIGLQQTNLWPARTKAEIKYSPRMLANKIWDARYRIRTWAGHSDCGKKYAGENAIDLHWRYVWKGWFLYVPKEVPPILTDAHLRHFGLEPNNYEGQFEEGAATLGFLPRDLPDIDEASDDDADTEDENYVPTSPVDDEDEIPEEWGEGFSDGNPSNSDTDSEDEELDD